MSGRRVPDKEVGVKRILLSMAAAALLLAPAAGSAQDATTSGARLVRIGGPPKLKAAKRMQFPVHCSAPCFVKVTSRFDWPGPDLVLTSSTTIQPGQPKVDRITLNGPATAHLKANYRQSHLRVIARARNLETNAHQNDNRSFGFHL
jgi:hypothetical protein